MSAQSPAQDGIPPYLRIAAELREQIDEGLLPIGHQIPTQERLCRRFAVSRATVQRALEELRRDGYIDSQQGRGSYVLDRSATLPVSERAMPGQAGVVLANHLNSAFEARHVTLDTFTLTTESLGAAIQAPLGRIRAGELQPESIRLRVLLPSLTSPLAVPRRVVNASDSRPLNRLRGLAQTHAASLLSSIASLADQRLVSDVAVEMRTVEITPLFKVYLFNGTEALSGYYHVVQRSVPIAGEDMEIYDFLGFAAMLFHHSAKGPDPDPYDQASVREMQGWFDSLWSTIAEPLTLFE